MQPQALRIDRHAVFLNVDGAGHRQINIAPAAHVAKAGKSGFARNGGHVAQAFLDVRGSESAQNLDGDLRIHLVEALQKGSETSGCETRRGRQTNVAAQRAVVVDDLLHKRVMRPHDGRHALNDELARIGKLHRPRIVTDEIAPERLLQAGNGSGKIGNVDAEKFRSRTQSSCFGKGDQIAPCCQIVKFGHHFLPMKSKSLRFEAL